MEGFTKVAGRRVEERADKLEQERWESDGGTAALVLADVSKRIEDKFGKVRYGTRRASSYSATGRYDGHSAGARADISGGRTKQMANRRALNS